MRCIFLPNNFKPDYLIYDNLINILTNSILNKSCCLDKETSLLLEQPINLLNYSNIEPDEDVEEYSKFELGMMVNNLLKERQYITELFERVDKERKVII